ncbi:MAG: mechanosensitive ion channel family protein [Planctomycetia bacterium]|jgi:MscS family membrane protein
MWFFSLLILFLASVSYTSAQIPVPTPPAPDTATVSDDKPQEPEIEEVYRQKVSLSSPNDVLIYFREAFRKHEYEKASRCFQLSREQRKMDPKELSNLAWKLGASLDRINQQGMWTAGKDQEADPHLIKTGDAGQLIIIDQNDKGDWGFTSKTIAIIDDVYERVKDREVVQGRDWLRDQFPKALQNRGFLIPYYQWICLFGVILIGAIVDLIARHILNRLTLAWFKFRKVEISPKLERGVWKPIGLLIRAIVWYYGTVLIGIQPEVLRVLLVGVHFFAVVAAVWTAFRFIDLLAVYLQGKAALTETKFDDLLIPLVSRTLKVFAVCIGILIFAETFDLPVMGLLGGMGVGGIAIAFAAKDTIGNIFGSITVLVDRPFEIGDWIVTDNTEGTVESVGIRSTRVRTFYNSLITIPNSLLTTAVVDNMGRRRYRRYKAVVGVEYSTDPEQIEAFCEGIRELIRRHPYTRKDYYHVYLNEFSSSSLDILVYMFFDCPDWAMELRERHRLILDIIRLAKKLKIQFAFPTQTLHVNQFTHTDPDIDLGNDPFRTGRQQAAHVTGPVLSRENRPGRVEYLGPVELHEAESHDGDNGDDGDSA